MIVWISGKTRNHPSAGLRGINPLFPASLRSAGTKSKREKSTALDPNEWFRFLNSLRIKDEKQMDKKEGYTEVLFVRIKPSELDRINRMSELTDRPVSRVVRSALDSYWNALQKHQERMTNEV